MENHPLFLSVFATVAGCAACAWGAFPELNALIHLEPFPDDAFRWKVSFVGDDIPGALGHAKAHGGAVLEVVESRLLCAPLGFGEPANNPESLGREADRSRRGAAQTGSPAPRRARRCVIDVHQGPLHARHRARSGRSARGGAESVASRRARSAGFSIPRERRTENGARPSRSPVSLARPTDARFARFASRPASALARNLDPRPARARGLGKCRRCRPTGGSTQPVHFFVRHD